jgi:pyridinium-3,5-biscarboxylic acid mononucleotide synthase
MNPESLHELLTRLVRGELTVAAAAGQLAAPSAAPSAPPPTFDTGSALVDLDRARRCGFPEVVYSPGKTATAIIEILRAQRAHGQACLATRITPEQALQVIDALPEARHNPVARTLRLGESVHEPNASLGLVAVVTAGTSDLPVAEEALETLRWMGCEATLVTDVGVAGPQRLLARLPLLRSAKCVIAVAGMEAALASVVGGHVACPVIAVPTSVGYGANFGGVAALLGMLNSCAANVTVVNIDAGFKAGFVAGLIVRR